MSLGESSGAPERDLPTGLVLGVDGGGTKTEAWLARSEQAAEPAVIGRGRAASSNPRAIGLAPALANLGSAIDAAWADAAIEATLVDYAVLAISGAGHPSMRQEIAAWAQSRRLASEVRFEHDAEPVLAEGTPDGWGVALIVGTGSAAIGADRQQRRAIVGGWGFRYGDEGSAYWIGKRALDAMARASDGRGEHTLLAEVICRRLQTEDPRAVLGLLEQTGDVRGAIAALAQPVEEAAGQSDAVALAIIDDAASELALMVATLASKLELGETIPLALAGGVVCGSERLRSALLAALEASGLRPDPVNTVPHPVAGCVRLAGRALRGNRSS